MKIFDLANNANVSDRQDQHLAIAKNCIEQFPEMHDAVAQYLIQAYGIELANAQFKTWKVQ